MVENKKAPVIFIIYNRPGFTKLSFDSIRAYKPDRLYIIADGPKNEQDNILCQKAREVIKTVDWDCEINKNFAEENMGCGKRVSSGITWAFNTCDRAIILEDDCIPNLSFFRFCEELLQYYNEDHRIGMVSGNSIIDPNKLNYSYYFSNFFHIWGWATWKRAWDNFDLSINKWPTLKKTDLILNKVRSTFYADKWNEIFDRVYKGDIDTWAYPLVLKFWENNHLSIVPKYNLVSNIGFTNSATHTNNPKDKNSKRPTKRLTFPLSHPELVIPNKVFDQNDLIWDFGEKPPLLHNARKMISIFTRKGIGKINSIIKKL